MLSKPILIYQLAMISLAVSCALKYLVRKPLILFSPFQVFADTKVFFIIFVRSAILGLSYGALKFGVTFFLLIFYWLILLLDFLHYSSLIITFTRLRILVLSSTSHEQVDNET